MQVVQSTAQPEEPTQLAREVRELGSVHTLYASGDYQVLVAARQVIPRVMNEIGRLRELSFRAVGEGTGKDRDIDAFDDWHQQRFVWQRSTQRVRGACPLCMTGGVRRRHGAAGLYTDSLFEFGPSFLDELGP